MCLPASQPYRLRLRLRLRLLSYLPLHNLQSSSSIPSLPLCHLQFNKECLIIGRMKCENCSLHGLASLENKNGMIVNAYGEDLSILTLVNLDIVSIYLDGSWILTYEGTQSFSFGTKILFILVGSKINRNVDLGLHKDILLFPLSCSRHLQVGYKGRETRVNV
ncbi:hypothetical protein M9H77_37223 [Catharanthus roseus]|uniref:Uncharacterized protein n=1 Tax=Catharanthus roseus TaxID=4058 RepID=A0ACB9ZW03_CATRO|nr:hypothetical protein M9H77_37223 [Catharanthus roseus]